MVATQSKAVLTESSAESVVSVWETPGREYAAEMMDIFLENADSREFYYSMDDLEKARLVRYFETANVTHDSKSGALFLVFGNETKCSVRLTSVPEAPENLRFGAGRTIRNEDVERQDAEELSHLSPEVTWSDVTPAGIVGSTTVRLSESAIQTVLDGFKRVPGVKEGIKAAVRKAVNS